MDYLDHLVYSDPLGKFNFILLNYIFLIQKFNNSPPGGGKGTPGPPGKFYLCSTISFHTKYILFNCS